MTPVTAATATASESASSTRESARAVFRAAPIPPQARPMSPARPSAVLIPPIVVYLASIGVVALVHGILVSKVSVLTVARAMFIVAVTIPSLYVVRSIIVGLRGQRWCDALLPAVAAIFIVLLDLLIPGFMLNWPTAALLFVLSLSAGPLTRIWQQWWVRHRPARVTLLASTEWGADEATRRLELVPGLVVTGVVIPGCDPASAQRILRRPVSGDISDLSEDMDIEKRLIVSCPSRDTNVNSTIARLVARGHTISSESAVLRAAEGRIDTDLANPLSLLLGRPRHWFSNAASRVMDVLLSFVMLIVLAPLFAIVALAILIEDGRPIFYHQRRTGLRGRLFDVIKFRSMYRDAESRSGPVWAAENDPRITNVGRLLRRTRIDELPQLFNVLVGQMALVGPRPERPHFFDILRRDVPLFELRTIVRPGITGWAQIRAPYAAGPEDARYKLEYDLYYVNRRSPWFDLAILFETVGVAFSGRGAR